MKTAQKNSQREKHGHRYENDIKYFSTYLFIIAGPFVYEFLYANLSDALPSRSVVEKTLSTASAPVKEGKFRFLELQDFLTQHNLPKKVFISEDGTRILQKFLYDLTSDQIIGPVPPLAENGVVITDSFPASSAALIATHFEKNVPSSSAYAIMATPVQDGAPSFCLSIFGTDNAFSSVHVCRRWCFIYQELAKLGIEVVGYASDGDPKLLSAMQAAIFKKGDPPFLIDFKDFFFASCKDKFTVMQDYIHTVNKFRTRLSPTNYLPIGSYVASQSHLRILIREKSREDHLLTLNDLDKEDKMNFNSSVKICSEKVTNLLQDFVPNSNATVAYLLVMRYVMQAGLDKNLSPLERIYKIWYAVHFFRYWKNWLEVNSKFTSDNFVTRNLYVCVEIIAHSLIFLIIKFREENCPEFILPHLYSSQPCESFFRLARSMTTTESTVINFPMKVLLQKIRRIDMLHHVTAKLSEKLEFPRDKRKRLLSAMTAEKMKTTYIPSNEEIRTAVMQAKTDAVGQLRKLGVRCPPDLSPAKIKSTLMSCRIELEEDPTVSISYEATVDEDDVPLNLLSAFPTPDSVCDLHPYGDPGPNVLPAKSSHIVVPDNKGGFRTISKSLFCYILSSGGGDISNIRIHRVREKVLRSVGGIFKNGLPDEQPKKKSSVEIGDWCIFNQKSLHIVGQILGFKYLSGKSLSYTLTTAPVEPPQNCVPRGIGCLVMVYVPDGVRLVKSSYGHKYLNINTYVATIPAPTVLNSILTLCLSAHNFVLSL